MTVVHDRAFARGVRADQETRDFFDRSLRGGKADALQAPPADVIEPFQGEREVRTAPRLHHGMYFIDYDGAGAAQHLA